MRVLFNEGRSQMKSWMLVSLAGLFFLVAGSTSAQTCRLPGTLSDKLVYQIPQVYGAFGFGTTADPAQSVLFTGDHPQAHFSSDFLATLAPINEVVGIQASQFPPASPSC